MPQPVQQVLTVVLTEVRDPGFHAANEVTGEIDGSRMLFCVRFFEEFLKRQAHDFGPLALHLSGSLIQPVGKCISDPNG